MYNMLDKAAFAIEKYSSLRLRACALLATSIERCNRPGFIMLITATPHNADCNAHYTMAAHEF